MKFLPLTLALFGAAYSATITDTAELSYGKTSEAKGARYILKQISQTEVQGAAEEARAEFITYNYDKNIVYAVNSLDKQVNSFKLKPNGNLNHLKTHTFTGTPNSIAYKDGILAVAVADDDEETNGTVEIFVNGAATPVSVPAGVLPDHVSFGPNGCLFSANEAEGPAVGGITQICSEDGFSTYTAHTVTFDQLITKPAALKALKKSDLVFSKLPSELTNQDAVADLEPEYITYSKKVNKNGKFGIYVVLQESNAIATFQFDSIATPPKLKKISPLGFKDYAAKKNKFDLTDDGEINLIKHRGVFGTFQPDTISSFRIDGEFLLAFANEGDAWDEAVVGELSDSDMLTKKLKKIAEVAPDLEVIPTKGFNEKKGKYEELYSFGGRSFSFYDPKENQIVFDSGNKMSAYMKKYAPELFNAKGGTSEKLDNRSPKKGGEPETVVFGKVDGKLLIFVSLERPSLIGIFEVSAKNEVLFHSFNGSIDCNDPVGSNIEDPEAFVFVPENVSPTGDNLLIVSGSDSNNLTVFKLKTTKKRKDLYLFDKC